jgi:HipA-like protein
MPNLIVQPRSGSVGADRWILRGVNPEDLFVNTHNQPVLVDAVGPEGERADWVLKPFSRIGGPCSISELVGSRFARWMGVPVPDFGVIDVSAETLNLIQAPTADRLRGSLGPNFGSRFVSGVIELERSGSVAVSARGVACDIFCLDVIVDNADRNLGRSNVLVGNAALLAIDHEHTFSYFALIGGVPAWQTATFHRLSLAHFFSARFPRWRGALDELHARLGELDAPMIDELLAHIPDEWLTGSGGECVRQIRSYLTDVAGRRDEILNHLRGGIVA